MSDTAPNLALPAGRYEMMLMIRLLEERIARLFQEGKIHGTAHLCIGQEACAVGAVSAAQRTDPIVSTHRGHGHFLARSADPAALMAELLGKVTGPCMGRGGSQHLCSRDLAFYGTNGITGGGIPIATGLALSQKLDKTALAVLCFFGDGAANQGTFHESLNMASIWNLPVVYICENNLYAMSTPIRESMRVSEVADRAAAYGLEAMRLDGMDVDEVREGVGVALRRARAGEGPTLVEAKCYRFCGHSKSDRLVYRSREEEERWRRRDPISSYRERLISRGLRQDELRQLERRAAQRIERAYEQAQAAEEPAPQQVLVPPYRKVDTGP